MLIVVGPAGQVINLRNCCIWLVDLFEKYCVHLCTNFINACVDPPIFIYLFI
jgi:hypothetical protein